MKFIWLSLTGLGTGLLAGFLLKGIGVPLMMLISAATVAVIELFGVWWRARER
jgi:hypothetical protein